MAHKITLSLILLSVLKVVVSQYNCNINEYLTESANPCNSCDYRGWCPENYGVACDCIPGYFRNSQGICVPPEACDGPYGTSYGKDVPPPKICRDRNEEYTECGSACAPTCEDNSNRVCPAVCVPGCFCRRGYVKNSYGMCVRLDQCNRGYSKETYNCGANEEFQSCGTSCPATCDNPQPNSGACIQRCVTGCFCTTGYVRKAGKCVKESECNAPSVGPRNYYGSGPYGPRPYRPLPRPIPNPPVVLPPPKPPTYPAPPPPIYKPPVRPVLPPPPPPPPMYKPPVRPVLPPPPPPPPTGTKGCPNRNLCNRNCKLEGFAVGFCVGEGFLKCNCMG